MGSKPSTRPADEHRLAVVESLLRASRAVLEHRSFETAARTIFNETRRMTGAVSGYVALLSMDGQENEVVFLEAGGLSCVVDPDLPMPIRGLRAQAYRDNRPVFENDFMGSDWAALMPAGHVRLNNVLFAPLSYDGTTHGVMGLANKPQDFTAEDALLATAFGEYAAIALRNSRNLDRLKDTVNQLQLALDEVSRLRGILPICMACKKIRDSSGYWHQVEQYIAEHSQATFSHGLCEDCLARLYPESKK